MLVAPATGSAFPAAFSTSDVLRILFQAINHVTVSLIGTQAHAATQLIGNGGHLTLQ